MEAPMPLDALVTTATLPPRFFVLFVLIELLILFVVLKPELMLSTRNQHNFAGDPSGIFRCQEGCHFSNILRLAYASQWGLCLHLLVEIRSQNAGGPHAFRFPTMPGLSEFTRDLSSRAQFLGQRLRGRIHRPLGGAIN